ncbi:MAG: hypothetical protein RI983_1551 [Bacteroidota bacterium]|jgi:hypothetical protein
MAGAVLRLNFCAKNPHYAKSQADYWYDVKPYVQIIPSAKNEFGRLWYGWEKFGQGGINEKGLVLDGAITPKQKIPIGFQILEKVILQMIY